MASHKPQSIRPLVFVATVSNFDRFVISPMLVSIAVGFHVPTRDAVQAATSYFFAYGLAQPFWGVLSDRRGRVLVLRIALLGAAAASIASALAPSIGLLTVFRALAGSCFGAAVPTSITYVGDTVALDRRQRAIADLLAMMAVGSSLATLTGGVIAQDVSWRFAYVLSGVCAFGGFCWLGGVRETSRPAIWGDAFDQLGDVIKKPWSLFVIFLVFLEGTILFGVFTLLPTIMQRGGTSATDAGALSALYGLAVLLSSQVVKRMVVKRPPWLPIAIGGSSLCAGELIGVGSRELASLTVTAVCLGVAYSFLHSSLQTWMTTTAPRSRATAVALFSAALFFGSSVGSSLGGHFVQQGHTIYLFIGAAVIAMILVLLAGVGRRHYLPPTEK